MAKVSPRTLSGFMELAPKEQMKLEKMMEILRRSYALYGFTPLDTPVIEAAEVLLAKGGGETEKQIYRFQKGENDLALRFDLTVPLAKYVAIHAGELCFPSAATRSARSTAASAPSAAASVSFIRLTSTSSATGSSTSSTRRRSPPSSMTPSRAWASSASRSA